MSNARGDQKLQDQDALPSAGEAARLIGGEAHGQRVRFPGPGHSKHDRSAELWLRPNLPGGFLVNSFAGDDWRELADYVRDRLNLPAPSWRKRFPSDLPMRSPPITVPDADQARNTDLGLKLWNGARALRGTPAANYLRSRRLDVSEDLSHAVRFSASLWLHGKPACGMIALMRDAITDAPCGLHRTFLHPDGRPVLEYVAECARCAPAACRGHKVRKMLGRAKGAAIKLDAHEDVGSGLHVGEGVESAFAARQLGYRPAWAIGAAGFVADLPVLAGLEALSVFGENDRASENAARAVCDRYRAAGCETFLYQPPQGDFNDTTNEAE